MSIFFMVLKKNNTLIELRLQTSVLKTNADVEEYVFDAYVIIPWIFSHSLAGLDP